MLCFACIAEEKLPEMYTIEETIIIIIRFLTPSQPFRLYQGEIDERKPRKKWKTGKQINATVMLVTVPHISRSNDGSRLTHVEGN